MSEALIHSTRFLGWLHQQGFVGTMSLTSSHPPATIEQQRLMVKGGQKGREGVWRKYVTPVFFRPCFQSGGNPTLRSCPWVAVPSQLTVEARGCTRFAHTAAITEHKPFSPALVSATESRYGQPWLCSARTRAGW